MESTKKMKEQSETGNQSSENKGQTQKSDTNEDQRSSTPGSLGGNLGSMGSKLTEKGGEVVGQAKEVATDVYNRASKGLNQGYNQAVDYGRENPGTATLIAFGAGLGVGLLLSGTFTNSSRSRTSRLVPPVMNALSEIAAELFRR